MDTKVPPIASRTHDRCQEQYYQQQQQQQQQLHKKSLLLQQEQEKQVTLPPLPAFSAQRHRAIKFSLSSNWRNGVTTPKVHNQQDIQRCQPYKVLEIGATPLMHACQQADRVRVLRLLKEQEETIGYRDRALRSAIHYCMDASTGGAVAQAAPELLNDPDAEGHTALHLAVIAGDAQLVAVLLASGADVNAKDLEGHSVLHWATVCGEVECVRLVLAAGARASSADLRGGSPLHYAAQCCGAAATAELAIPKKLGLKVLHTLLEFGADVHACDEDGRQPILWAASAGSVEAVLALVRAGGSTVATASDKDGLTALHCAASRGHARCIEVLVNLCDAQSDHVDNNGCSALHYAATLGHADATSLLLKLGADPNRQDRKGRTPALCAAAKGQLESLKILAQQGASLHARTVRGTGLGHEAVASGRLELLKWLSKRRPSLIHVATQDGKTPLHVAALYGYLDACKLLIDSGARINALMRTSKGILMTVLDAALYRAHRDCAKFIQLHGGMTAQHLKLHKGNHIEVDPSKLHAKHVETSSDSEFNDIRSCHRHRQYHHRDPEVYYEERWVERRIRRRANRRRQFRQNSRSFSEEQPHRSKSSSTARATNRQRRALSENARYESSDSDLKKKNNNSERRGILRRRKKNEIHARRKNNQANKSGSESIESEDPSRSFKSGEESSSVSDDSLEVILVKKLLESKSEKIIVGKVLKKEILKRNILNHEQAFINTDGDTSNKDTVEQITISADIHLNKGLNMSTEKNLEVVKRMNIEQEPDQHAKNKMDNILGKADEIQNALLAKAADLKKDMEEMRYYGTSSSSPTSEKNQISRYLLRPSTEKRRTKVVSNAKLEVLESSEECSPDRSAIIAVIESPEWDEEHDEELDKKIRKVIGNMKEHYEDEIEDNDSRSGDKELGIVRVLSSVSEKEMNNRASIADSLPQLQPKLHERLYHLSSSHQQQHNVENEQICQRHDSGGRDSGIEPSPRISRIPKRTLRCYPNSKRQQALHMDMITRDVQISMRRYHLERKIFFQLMELKRLQIRHGRTNEHVLVKRQVDAFHKAGMNGPLLGVTRYDHQPFTFRNFEIFLYEQLRKLQKRPTTPDWCTDAKQCIQKTHRCHHATSAYTSVPIYTYLGGVISKRMNLLPKIESHGKGRMTVEVTHGEEKKVISLPSEKLDRAKRYYVTFTVRGETTDGDKTKTPPNSTMQRNTNSI
ncbi:PREDICTED: inversin [Ceratosolen solmsi marchali]|uniref:Inversin n=1 Tax=Ceratosolen solmsi marchali TaxID=326594 RepID=A0AAJ6YSY7_9HYME|nr:PREDICTED: inversin [Ceratosolen solmsi marchali]